jgi:hypothetical protein
MLGFALRLGHRRLGRVDELERGAAGSEECDPPGLSLPRVDFLEAERVSEEQPGSVEVPPRSG